MKTKLLLDGKKFPGLITGLGLVLVLSGCEHMADQLKDKPASPGEHSLKSDQDYIQKLRKNIPAEKQVINDDLAETLAIMGEGKKEPGKVRDDFEARLRKKREDHRKDVMQSREKFNREERKARDQFLKKQQSQRTAFTKNRHDRETSKTFYEELEQNRRDYFAKEKETRSDYESDMREKSKDFESYIKEKRDQFYQEWNVYKKKYHEQKKLGTGADSSQLTEDERQAIQQMPNVQGTPLAPNSDGN